MVPTALQVTRDPAPWMVRAGHSCPFSPRPWTALRSFKAALGGLLPGLERVGVWAAGAQVRER